mmetsp:Transcript_37026/g.69041  ORF Transcript_37026/g.69041 Transcript_37026/m.69041 type:complete len:145 (+) Transcript_37026:25-459(+)
MAASKKMRIGYDLDGRPDPSEHEDDSSASSSTSSDEDAGDGPWQLEFCKKCARKSVKKHGFDPVAALEDLALDVQISKCFKQCKRGPNARVVRPGAEKGIVVAGMTDKEAKHKCFHEVNSTDAAARVAKLISKLAESPAKKSVA